jgi:hypothetical protein
MSKHKDPLLEELKQGHSYTWTVPEGGDLASMRNAIKHGQTLTMSPVVNPSEVQVGDMVLVQWHKSTIFHLVGEIQDDKFLIVNSVGKINGWVSGSALLGKITKIIDPELRPSLEDMLDQLETTYHKLIDHEQPIKDDAWRLLAVAEDLRWYAGRIGADRWDKLPRSNKWSFEQNLWRLTRHAKNAAASTSPLPVRYFIDRGKECVGLAAELLSLFEPGEVG